MLWFAAAIVLLLDQTSKSAVVAHFLPNESRVAVPHLLYWTFVQNTRGAFGLFGDSPWLLIVMALAVLGLFWYAFRDAAAHSRLVQAAFGAIAGGALGNIVDRLHYRFVVDFIDLRWWPVFNVADSCITIGVLLLVVATAAGRRQAAVPERTTRQAAGGYSIQDADSYAVREHDERALARLRGRSSAQTHEFDPEL